MTEKSIELAVTPNGTKPVQPQFEVEQGVTFPMPFSSPYRGTNQVIRRDPVSATQMAHMFDTDGQARALFRLITLPIRAAMKNATFVAAEGGEEEAAFINNMFSVPPQLGGMVTPFERVMEQILLGISQGFSAFEKVYWVPQTGPLKGKITLKKLGHRPADSVTFLTDDGGHLLGIRQLTSSNGRRLDVKIDVDDLFYYAANESERPFYGVSYFRSAFYHYDIKHRMGFVMNTAAQIAASGLRVGTHPVSVPDRQKAEFDIALANLGAFQSMSMPLGYDVKSIKEGGNFDFLAAINYHGSQMSKSVLAGFFDDSQGTSANTTPMVDFGQKTDEFFTLMLKTIMNDIAAQINHYIIPKFIQWNFDTDKYPTYQWGAFTNEQLESIRTMFNAMAVAGPSLNVTPEFFRAAEKKISIESGFEIDYNAVDKREAQQKAEADALAKQQAAIGQQHLTDLHANNLAKQQSANPQFSDRNNQQGGNNPPPNPAQTGNNAQ